MDVEDLLKKQEEANTKFVELRERRDEIDAELNRLQGEYRAYSALIEADPAKTIKAEGKKVKDGS